MMKVYGHPLSSCTRKVLITMMEKRCEHAFATVDLFTGEHKGAAHVALHPFGVIPVLVDDDFTLYESRAIIRYLDAARTGTPLTPKDTKAAARMDQWLSVDQSYVAPYTRALAVERILKKHDGKEQDAALAEAAEKALATAFTVVDRALASSEWLAGDTFTLADISLAPYVASLPMLGAQHTRAGLTHLEAWWKRVESRASVAAVLGARAH